MRGPSRYDFKHGIRKQTEKKLREFPPPPIWNPFNLRRSLTLRAHKAYSDACLQRAVEHNPGNASLQARLASQMKYRPQTGAVRLNNTELKHERDRAAKRRPRIHSNPLIHARFDQKDLTFTLTPEAVSASARASNSPAATYPTVPGMSTWRTATMAATGEQDLQEALRRSLLEVGNPTGGNLLGTASKPLALDERVNDTEEKELREAIRLSLMGSNNHQGTASDPVVLDNDENGSDDEEDRKPSAVASLASTPRNTTTSKRSRDPSTVSPEEHEREKIRVARLRHFSP